MAQADSPEGSNLTFQVGHRGALQANIQGSYNGNLEGDNALHCNGGGLQGVSQGDCWGNNDWRSKPLTMQLQISIKSKSMFNQKLYAPNQYDLAPSYSEVVRVLIAGAQRRFADFSGRRDS